ncbi:MAG TPA: hydantoinase/carbamoylase family amidase [Bauldia sp.]|nr:hydantoinase/carbamoylase family amidase [Bauldia sp.]
MRAALSEIDIGEGLKVASQMLADIGARTSDGVGITRTAYGEGEQLAHDMVAALARDLGLEPLTDAALNLYITMPGSSRTKAPIFVGSHLDSVPRGGNYDGLAGVAAGMACLVAFHAAGVSLERDLTLLAIRAEENYWFSAQHVGSRAALGTLSASALATATRADTGRPLAEHMREAGCDVDALGNGRALIQRTAIACFLECHIEQGPVLIDREIPIGIVTAIRGNRRCKEARCVGAYGHSGAEPRALRRDAVFAAAELVGRVEEFWIARESEGEDLVVTFGKFTTDASAHGLTVIPGEVVFTIDVRSHSTDTLDRTWAFIQETCVHIAERRNVAFRFEGQTQEAPVAMDAELRRALLDVCAETGVPAFEMASGGGHDAGDFAAAGIPAAMIFVRNANGSHNPDEAMDFADFATVVRVLARTIQHIDGRMA